MKKRQIGAVLLSMITAGSLVFQVPVYAADPAEDTDGTTYYVSSENGDDSNSGTSEGEAFETLDKINEIELEPGDKVLLEKGSVFDDQYLHVKGSGSAEEPIVISSYGKGDRPQINANGRGVWYQDYGAALDNPQHKYRGNVSSAVLLYDVEYIEISGLEITNDRESGIDPADEGLEWNDLNVMDRTGVAGMTQNIGTANHIVLDDLYIHDVDGNVYNKHMLNGGIYFIVGKADNEAATGIPKYDDLQITNCHVENVDRWGIAAAYTAYHGQFNAAEISDETAERYGSTNVVISNNYIREVGGDAITTMYCDRPLVENNVSDGAAKHINNTDYSATSFGRVAAGIWPWKCKNAVFQYNEVYNMYANQDGQAWDADWGDGTLYQYNYSHNNSGGAVMFCGEQAVNNTFRYNISYLDLAGLNPAGNPDAHVYNNVFYMPAGVDFIRSNMSGGHMVLENNIIYNAGDTAKTETWFKQSDTGRFKYDNNLYYNYANTPSNDANAVSVAAGTRIFGDLSKVPTDTEGTVNPHSNPDAESVFDGFRPAEGSPAVNAGKVITDANGFEVEKDFFGNTVGAVPDIGAAESDVVSLTLASSVYRIENDQIEGLGKNTTVADFLSNLVFDDGVSAEVRDGERVLTDQDIVKGGMTVVLVYGDQTKTYTIQADSDNELKSAVYMVKDHTLYVPFTEKNPATAGEVIGNVTAGETASVSILNGDETLGEDEAVADGMTLRITAENGAVNDYTITQKNTYNWTLDYAGPQQGNVWFGQMRTGDGAWTDISGYDPTYPNWQVNTYYGPGVDAPSHTAQLTDEVHGLLSAPPNTDITTAMAFRAPKTGTVSFSVKDDEPYLRQAGNSGGTVTLSLLLNEEVLQSVTLESSNVQSEDWADFDAIQVKEGDYIRVTAKSNNNPTKPSLHVTPVITYQDIAGEKPEADKTELEAVITDADEYAAQIDSYTPETAEAFQTAYDAAKAVASDKDASQEEVDSAAAALQAAIDGLEKVQQAGEISTAVLEYTLKLAEDVDTEGVVDSVVEIFNNTKAEARDLLDRVQAKDPSVTQSMVDQCWEMLLRTMQYMSFKQGDMTDLQKVVDLANSLDLSRYLETGKKEFTDALTAAEAVLAEEFAEQSEIDQAWKTLLKAMSELRLKPSKEALEALIAQAESLRAEGTDEETAEVLRSALARAKSVLEDSSATEEEVAVAESGLRAAIDRLLASADNGGGTASDDTALNTPSQTVNSQSAAAAKPVSNSGKKTAAAGSKAVKTGDTSDFAVWAAVLLSAGVIAAFGLRKKIKN